VKLLNVFAGALLTLSYNLTWVLCEDQSACYKWPW